jgi:hypothetical protein
LFFLTLSDCISIYPKPADQEKLEHFPDQPAQQTHLAMTEIGLVGAAYPEDGTIVRTFNISSCSILWLEIHILSGSENL